MGAIFKRELKTYFQTPIGYIFSSLFLLISGILFSLALIRKGKTRILSQCYRLSHDTVMANPVAGIGYLLKRLRMYDGT